MKPKIFKPIGQDEELQAHLKSQMDEVYGPEEETFAGEPLNPRPLSHSAVVENLTSAAIEGKLPVDMVNLPPHYAAFSIEPIRFAQENGLDFLQSNIIKYIVRWKLKNGLEDLAKAKRCLEMYIRYAEGNPDWWKRAVA